MRIMFLRVTLQTAMVVYALSQLRPEHKSIFDLRFLVVKGMDEEP